MRAVVPTVVAILASAVVFAGADGPSTSGLEDAPPLYREQFREATFVPATTGDLPDLDRPDLWRALIDEVWGDDLPTEVEVAVFDQLWNEVDREYACFQDLKSDWDQVRERYRPEVLEGTSRGRFAAIVNHMGLALRETHTRINDTLVNGYTALVPGVPLMWIGRATYDSHFGACLTPQPDRSLLVYAVGDDHPLGLEPGDRVLGYDGVPWIDLARRLLALELPVSGAWGSSDNSFEHSLLEGAGMNWHLFGTIDVVKHDTGELRSLSTSPLVGGVQPAFCTEQIEPPGVQRPDLVNRQELFTWGIVEGTRIGYIYGFGYFWNAGPEFREAVRQLMFEHETLGLILDFRTNFGGNMFLSNPALGFLFDGPVETIGFAARADPADRLAMEVVAPPSIYVIPGDPASSYDRPIAVLTGPGAASSGDQVAYRMTFHPRARTFGKTTATAFNAPTDIRSIGPFTYQLGVADAYAVSAPGEYLTHDDLVVDRPVWLAPDDVAAGVDTVVREAICWIRRSGVVLQETEAGGGGRWGCRD